MRYDDQRGPVVLVVILITAMLVRGAVSVCGLKSWWVGACRRILASPPLPPYWLRRTASCTIPPLEKTSYVLMAIWIFS